MIGNLVEIPAWQETIFIRYDKKHGPLANTEVVFPQLVQDEFLSTLPTQFTEYVRGNCHLYVHFIWDYLFELGYLASPVPKCFRSAAIALSEQHFVAIELNEPHNWKIGDVLLTGSSVETGPESYHLAVLVGWQHAEPLFAHVVSRLNKELSSAVLWKLSDFEQSKFHATIFGMRRPKTPIRLSSVEESLFWELAGHDDEHIWQTLYAWWNVSLTKPH